MSTQSTSGVWRRASITGLAGGLFGFCVYSIFAVYWLLGSAHRVDIDDSLYNLVAAWALALSALYGAAAIVSIVPTWIRTLILAATAVISLPVVGTIMAGDWPFGALLLLGFLLLTPSTLVSIGAVASAIQLSKVWDK